MPTIGKTRDELVAIMERELVGLTDCGDLRVISVEQVIDAPLGVWIADVLSTVPSDECFKKVARLIVELRERFHLVVTLH